MRQRATLVLYMNLRPVNNGFPQRDKVPTRILTENLNVSSAEYGARCCAFFTAIFNALNSYLSHFLNHDNGDTTATIRKWNGTMCNMSSRVRAEFFDSVEWECKEVCVSIHDADEFKLMAGSKVYSQIIKAMPSEEISKQTSVDTQTHVMLHSHPNSTNPSSGTYMSFQ